MADQPGKLSELMIAEIKKAFAMCDSDGNGCIDASELSRVMEALLEERPSESELQQLMTLVDQDKSGTIELSEFLTAMASWLQEDYRAHGGGALVGDPAKKRGRDEERQDVHKKIKGFFTQFKKTATVDAVRETIAKAKAYGAAVGGGVGGGMELDRTDLRGGLSAEAASSKEKLEMLMYCKRAMGNLEAIAQNLAADSPYQQLEATSALAKLLSIVEVFSTPMERRTVAEIIVKIYEFMVQYQLGPRLVKFLACHSHPQLQWEACRALSHFAPGPRIASTPDDSLLNPDKMFFKKIVIVEGAVPLLVALLASPVDEVKTQACIALGCIAAYNPECRDFVLMNQALPSLLAQVNHAAKVPFLRRLSWTLSILCGVTHPLNHLPNWDHIAMALPSLGTLLFVADEEIVIHVCAALALVMPGVPDANVCRRLVELLTADSVPIQRAALRTLIDVMRFDEKQTELFLHYNLLKLLADLLRSADNTVRIQVCDALIVLAGVRGMIQPMLASGVHTHILNLLSLDEVGRWKLVKVLKYLTRGNNQQVRVLVDAGVIRKLLEMTVFFKQYDAVLSDVYKYMGPSYNFEFARDLVHALQQILNVGEMEAEASTVNKVNQYALLFDMAAVDKLKDLLAATSEMDPAYVNAWRLAKPGDSSLEEKLKYMLWKLKQAHAAAGTSTSAHVAEMIERTWRKYFEEKKKGDESGGGGGDIDDAVAPNKLLLKLYSQNGADIRVLEVPRSVSIDFLLASLHEKYKRAVNVHYQDEEGDEVVVDTQDALEKAITMYLRAKGQRTLKLIISDKDAVAANTMATDAASSAAATTTTAATTPAAATTTTTSAGIGPSVSLGALIAPSPSLIPSALIPSALPAGAAFSLLGAGHSSEELKRLEKQAMFEQLSRSTHFSLSELDQLFASWSTQAKDGSVGRTEFEAGLKALGITDPLVIEQNWSAFDEDKNGTINFKEFVCGLSVVQRGSTDERLRFMFRAYDTDGSGSLSPDEVYNIFKASLQAKGTAINPMQIMDMVRDCFKQIDADGNGVLDFDEFKRAVESQKLLINCFVQLAA